MIHSTDLANAESPALEITPVIVVPPREEGTPTHEVPPSTNVGSSTHESTHPQEVTPPKASWRTDSLAEGVILMLVLAVGQRVIGFGRGLIFCRWLPPEELGQWDLVFSFLLLAAPLTVLGIPGSFVRYVEYYRQRGQLRSFLRRTGLVTLALTAVGVVGMVFFREELAKLIFDDASMLPLIGQALTVLVAVIAFNCLTELFTAMRRQRVVAMMQLASTLIFAAVGVLLLMFWQISASAVLIAYGVSCGVAALMGITCLRKSFRTIEEPLGTSLKNTDLWAKLLPFAFWVWVTNLAANMFAVADRYMIMHYSGLSPIESAGLVGNYHSSRVVPLLMVAVSGMLGGLIVPHLASDWEAGNREKVAARLNGILKFWGLVLLAGGATILAFSPLMFGWLLQGKYDGGLKVLPLTITYCIWFGMLLVAQSYLWCVEKMRLGSLAFFLGLAVNVGLNAWLVPLYKLPGAVLATAVANLSALLLLYALNQKLGLKLHKGVWVVTLLPLSLALGPIAAIVEIVIVAILAYRTDWIFTPWEKEQFADALEKATGRSLPWLPRGAAPAHNTKIKPSAL